jgi:hypothetical protein
MGSSRPPDIVYLDDDLSVVNKVGKVTINKFKKAGIINVNQLINIIDDQKQKNAFNSGLSITKINIIFNNAINKLVNSNAPPEVNYRFFEDPYFAKYGEENRDTEIKKPVMLSGNVCITDLVNHIYLHSKEAFRGTVHKDNWLFWHDAVSLITAKETILWMQEKGIYKHWLLPEGNLYANYPEVKKI